MVGMGISEASTVVLLQTNRQILDLTGLNTIDSSDFLLTFSSIEGNKQSKAP